ncbi:hypothetical protein V5O48_015835, partial [Marasmius crinis-equi]
MVNSADSGGASITALEDEPESQPASLSRLSPQSSTSGKKKEIISPASKGRATSSHDSSGDHSSLPSRIDKAEVSIEAMRQQLEEPQVSFNSNHVALLQMISDLKPSEAVKNPVECSEKLLAETKSRMESLVSSMDTLIPREKAEHMLSQKQGPSCPETPSLNAVLPLPSFDNSSSHLPTPGPSSKMVLAPNFSTAMATGLRTAPEPYSSYLPPIASSSSVAALSSLSLPLFKDKTAMEPEDSASSFSKRTKRQVGYVELGFTPSTDNPLHIAHYVADKLDSDFHRRIEDASWCRSRKGWVRIRFTDIDWAQTFIERLVAFARANPEQDVAKLSAYLVD